MAIRTSGSSAARTSADARANGSGAQTAKPCVARRRHRSSNSGRIPITSGWSTIPERGMPSGRAWIASTSKPSRPVIVIRSTSTSWFPSRSSAIPEPLHVPFEDGRLGEPGEAVLDRAGAGVADALHLHEIGLAGAHDLLQAREARHDVVGDGLGHARDLVQEPEAPGLDRAVEPDSVREPEDRR